MIKLVFKIVRLRPEKFELSLENMQRFPVHEDYLNAGDELILVYEFKPTRKLNIKEYTEFLRKKFKRKYNAYSVTVGQIEKQIEK